jgi:hypothetical protein
VADSHTGTSSLIPGILTILIFLQNRLLLLFAKGFKALMLSFKTTDLLFLFLLNYWSRGKERRSEERGRGDKEGKSS